MLIHSCKISFKIAGRLRDHDKEDILEHVRVILKGLGYKNYDVHFEEEE
ncbi:MAG: hypothetical protein OEL89_02565 [Candidatus Peregrinibacteria bacterium]|nr:hypothetical protein [Candidatus Peregrinibacteria bacterium]